MDMVMAHGHGTQSALRKLAWISRGARFDRGPGLYRPRIMNQALYSLCNLSDDMLLAHKAERSEPRGSRAVPGGSANKRSFFFHVLRARRVW